MKFIAALFAAAAAGSDVIEPKQRTMRVAVAPHKMPNLATVEHPDEGDGIFSIDPLRDEEPPAFVEVGWWRRRRRRHQHHRTIQAQPYEGTNKAKEVFNKMDASYKKWDHAIGKEHGVVNRIRQAYAPMSGAIDTSVRKMGEVLNIANGVRAKKDKDRVEIAKAGSDLDIRAKFAEARRAEAEAAAGAGEQKKQNIKKAAQDAIDRAHGAVDEAQVYHGKAMKTLKVATAGLDDAKSSSEGAKDAWRESKTLSREAVGEQQLGKESQAKAQDALMTSAGAINQMDGAIKQGEKAAAESEQALASANAATTKEQKIKLLTTALQAQDSVDAVIFDGVDASMLALNAHQKATQHKVDALQYQDNVMQKLLGATEAVRVIHDDNLKRTDAAIKVVDNLNIARDHAFDALNATSRAIDGALFAQRTITTALNGNLAEAITRNGDNVFEVQNLLHEVKDAMQADVDNEFPKIDDSINGVEKFEVIPGMDGTALNDRAGLMGCAALGLALLTP